MIALKGGSLQFYKRWDILQVFFKDVTFNLIKLVLVFYISEHFSMATSDVMHAIIWNIQSDIKTLLIYDLINNLGYLSVPYYSCIFVPWRKIKAGNIIQMKVKNDTRKTNGVEIIFNMKLQLLKQEKKLILYWLVYFEKKFRPVSP